ncbi:MAG: murein biosynthesis integral membrane protein MurJ [Chloroflexi bacterium]|nr:murein biosynthesis integral membrane protein MurJ [Chloroflexota bacterium]
MSPRPWRSYGRSPLWRTIELVTRRGTVHRAPTGDKLPALTSITTPMGIARAALIIMLGNVASRLLGVVREQVIAGLFGLTDAADAFSAASRVTTPIYDLLIGGMISAALIPVFSGYAKTEDEPELWRLVSIVLNLIVLLFVVFVVILIIFAPQLMMVFGYGFSPEKQAQAVALTRVMLVSVAFMGCAGVLTSVHYSRHRFGLPALCGAAYNLGIASMAIILHDRIGVASLAVGTLVGAALQVGVLLPGLRKMGMRYSLSLSVSHPSVRRIIALYLPVAGGLVVSAAGVTLDTNLASQTGEGSLTAMRFATTLIQLPLGLVAVAMGFAVLPTLSRYATGFANMGNTSLTVLPDDGFDGETANGEASLASFKETLALGIKLMFIAMIPATVGLVVVRTPVIQLLFQHGIFTAADTGRTAVALLFYSAGLPAAGLDQLLIFAFYARRNTVTPVLVGVFGIGVYLVVALALLKPMGMPGLALANSVQWISHALVMLVLLWRGLAGLTGFGIGATGLKVLTASAVMGATLLAVMPGLEGVLKPASGTAGLMVYLALLCGGGALVYGGALALLRVREVGVIWGMIGAKLGISEK